MTENSHTSLARTALFLLFLVSFFNYMDRHILSVLLPSIKLDLNLSDTALGAISTAFTISYVIFGIPLARIADRYTRRKVIIFSVTVWSTMTAACGFAQSFIQLAVARVLVGVGEAGAMPPSHSMISDYFPIVKRAKAIGIYSLGAPIGIMVGFIAASWIASEYSWRIAFLSLGAPGLILAIILYFKLAEPKRGVSDSAEIKSESEESVKFKDAVVKLWSLPAYRHICLGTGLYTVVWLGVVSWLPSYFVRSFDMNLTDVGVWLAMSVGISQIFGFLIGGALTDIMVKRDLRWYSWIAALGMFLSTPFFIIVFFTDNAIIANIALFPAFMIGVLQGPATLAAVQGLAHVRMRALATAVFLLITNLIGGTIGPFVAGFLSDKLVGTYGDNSLRYSLLILSLIFGFWAGLHYLLSSRTIAKEISDPHRVQPS